MECGHTIRTEIARGRGRFLADTPQLAWQMRRLAEAWTPT